MNQGKLSRADALTLWRRAEQRLRLVDREPPLSATRIDGLLGLLGPRRQGETVGEWLGRGGAASGPGLPSAEIIPFSPRRQRFVPVAEITRLAADSAGQGLALPGRELESADGRFRLTVSSEADQIVIVLQALGHASDAFAGRTLGLAGAGPNPEPVAVLQ
ncbi:MAG: hypothetical protein ACREH3_11630, partial [Geminicoccales bacterium]